MCLGTRLPGAPSLLVCVTHISNMSGNIGPQVDTVAGIINGLATDHAVVLGGDFNTDPSDPRLDPLYRGCGGTGAGRFDEADAGGCGNRTVLDRNIGPDVLNEDTFDTHKLDYIFLSDGHWSSATADAGDSTDGSDHNPLWATATFGRS
jgi:endonuclease/exonuclease/phosphatase family metal-dependent hydrolase